MDVVAINGAGCMERAEVELRFVRANDVDLVILTSHPVDRPSLWRRRNGVNSGRSIC
jgi:hypothetical protein